MVLSFMIYWVWDRIRVFGIGFTLRVLYTVLFFIKSWMFLELFLFAKKMKFSTKGGIYCISRSSLGTFILCAGTHWSNWRSMVTVLLILSYF